MRQAFLSFPLGLLVSRTFFDGVSIGVFKRRFSPPNRHRGNSHCFWSDWVLLLPFASGAILVVFVVGELVDYIRNENSWPLW